MDAAVYGNHEFDIKLDLLNGYLNRFKFPWILSNLFDKNTKKPLMNSPEYYIVQKGNAKVGLIGLIEEEWIMSAPYIDPNQIEFIDFCQKGKQLT